MDMEGDEKEMESLENMLGNLEKVKNEKQPEVIEVQKVEEQPEVKPEVKQEENKPEVIEPKNVQTSPIQEFSDNWRMAVQLARSTIIPQTYQNKPENVIVAVGMAQKLGLDPFTVMQNLNIVKGKTSWSGSFCRTLIEKSNKFTNLHLIFVGQKGTENYGCYMEGTDRETGEVIKGPEVNLKMAKAEGWTNNSKWINMPELMLSYRATSFFARVYVPEALNGVQTTEEIEDVFNANGKQKREVKDVL